MAEHQFYFWLQYGGKPTVLTVSNDVEPVEVDRMIIAPAETYDVVVTLTDNMSYEFKATRPDKIQTSVWLELIS